MRRWLNNVPWRRLRSSRRSAQDLVEYGLIVAAVAFVGILGVTAISRAEQTVFTSGPLTAPTPVKGFFLHRTSMTVDCGPPPPPQVVPGTWLSCSATVTDIDASPYAPNGTLRLTLDSDPRVISTCTPMSPTGSAKSSCALPPYQWLDSDASPTPHTVMASYSPVPVPPGTDHQANSVVWGGGTFNVVAHLDFAFSNCNNPWSVTNGWAASTVDRALIGQPLTCRLQVLVHGTSTGYPAAAVTLSSAPGFGFPWFSCFTDDGSNPNAYTLINDPICTPQHTWTCVTDPNGYCAVSGQTYFLYRRTFDYSGVPMAGPFTDQLTASALSQTAPSPYVLTIDAPSLHETGVSVNCGNNSVSAYGFTGNVRNPAYTIRSAQALNFGPGSLTYAATCEASVLDLDPNTVFDHAAAWLPGPGCGSFAIPLCDIDAVDTHTPLGCVLFEVKETADLTVPVAFTAGSMPTCPGLAAPNPNNWPACLVGLTHLSTIPSLVPPNAFPPPALSRQPYGRLNGQLAFVSYCNVQFSVPKDARWTVQTFYQGGAAHWPSGHLGATLDSFAAPDLTVVAN